MGHISEKLVYYIEYNNQQKFRKIKTNKSN